MHTYTYMDISYTCMYCTIILHIIITYIYIIILFFCVYLCVCKYMYVCVCVTDLFHFDHFLFEVAFKSPMKCTLYLLPYAL